MAWRRQEDGSIQGRFSSASAGRCEDAARSIRVRGAQHPTRGRLRVSK